MHPRLTTRFTGDFKSRHICRHASWKWCGIASPTDTVFNCRGNHLTDTLFPLPASIDDVEEGTEFAPRFDEAGLIPAMAIDAMTNAPLMFAFMNTEALRSYPGNRIGALLFALTQVIVEKGRNLGTIAAHQNGSEPTVIRMCWFWRFASGATALPATRAGPPVSTGRSIATEA